MFSFFSKKPKYSYMKVFESEEETQQVSSSSLIRSKGLSLFRLSQWVCLLFGSLALLFFGFILGQRYTQHRFLSNSPLHLETENRLFEHIPIYGDRPSTQSDAVWDALMPRRGGFFNHPEIAPKRSAYAVFHQLHCLNALREAYWTTLDAAALPTAMNIDEMPFEISPPHMRHCIDLLRQTLMCSPDLTVEVKNLTLAGVTGFGTVHQCRNWDQLMHWVRDWEDVGAPQSPPGNNHGHGHNHGT